jgi:uncharacterized membrane protein
MNLRPLVTIGLLILAAIYALTAWAWVATPPGAIIPTHWDLQGHANGHMQKTLGLLLSPIIATFTTFLFLAILRIEPRPNNLARSRGLIVVALLGTLVVMAASQGLIVFAALGHNPPVNSIIPPLVAFLIIAIGNFLPKSRSNFFFGVRTPWTLESDYSWEKTNRWAGRFLVATGLATLAAFVILGHVAAIATLTVGLTASAIAAIVMSYFFWTRDPERHGHDSVPE